MSNDSMSTETTPETLSQLMDGEWHGIDRSACVAGLCDDQALRARWARWHLARDAMRGEAVSPRPVLADRIRAAIDEEPAYSNVVGFGAGQRADASAEVMVAGIATPAAIPMPMSSVSAKAPAGVPPVAASASRWRQGAMGFGLAATVALATVAGLSLWQGAPQPGGDGAARVASVPAADPVVVAGVQTVAPQLPRVELVGNSGSYWVTDAPGGDGARSAGEERLNHFLAQHLEQASSASREGLLPYSRLVGYDESGAAGQR